MPSEWRRVGYATGWIVCRMVIPSIGLERENIFNGRSKSSLARLARLLKNRWPADETSLEGATLRISAEVRAPGLGHRQEPLARWQPGEPVLVTMRRALDGLARMPIEEEVDIAWRQILTKRVPG